MPLSQGLTVSLIHTLGRGDLRSKGQTDAIIRQATVSSSVRQSLWSALNHPDRLVRMRAADILEKVTTEHPAWITPHRVFLLKMMDAHPEKELRWHLIQLAGRTVWTPAQRRRVIRHLRTWYRHDRSNIVRVFSLQVLYDFCVLSQTALRRAARSATFSIRSRAKILLSTA